MIGELDHPTLTELAVAIHLTKPSVTIVVDRLLAKGFVRKQRSDTDRRSSLLYLTEQGEQIDRWHDDAHEDFGMQTLDSQGRGIMMEIVEDRHGKHSTMITSQVPVKEWHDIIGERTVADAILDRIVYHALLDDLLLIKAKTIQRLAPYMTDNPCPEVIPQAIWDKAKE